eukprot:7378363-Prymnesium_polylepis.1
MGMRPRDEPRRPWVVGPAHRVDRWDHGLRSLPLLRPWVSDWSQGGSKNPWVGFWYHGNVRGERRTIVPVGQAHGSIAWAMGCRSLTLLRPWVCRARPRTMGMLGRVTSSEDAVMRALTMVWSAAPWGQSTRSTTFFGSRRTD